MRPTIYIASFLLATAPAVPAAAQSTGTRPDTAPPSPGTVCAEREGRCDDGAVKGRDRDCVRDAERPCTDPPPVRTACLDEDRDRKCDRDPKKRRRNVLAALGGAITSIWVNTVPKDKGGGRDDGPTNPTPRAP